MQVTIESIVERWNSLDRPLFKEKLISPDGCKCAQGDVLSCAGYSDKELRTMTQEKADEEVAKILGISRTHAILLRQINDSEDGCPQLVLSNPTQILGDKSHYILAFWMLLDNLSAAASAVASDAALAAALAAASASNEIQGMDILESYGKQPYFLAFFGLKTWDDVRGLVTHD